MSTAGQNLKYLRKLRGWTQEEFANKLGIKRSLVGAYEEERADPRIDILEIVGDIFKLSLDELLLKDLSDTTAPSSPPSLINIFVPPPMVRTGSLFLLRFRRRLISEGTSCGAANMSAGPPIFKDVWLLIGSINFSAPSKRLPDNISFSS